MKRRLFDSQNHMQMISHCCCSLLISAISPCVCWMSWLSKDCILMSYLRDQHSRTPVEKKVCLSQRLSDIANTEGDVKNVEFFPKSVPWPKLMCCRDRATMPETASASHNPIYRSASTSFGRTRVCGRLCSLILRCQHRRLQTFHYEVLSSMSNDLMTQACASSACAQTVCKLIICIRNWRISSPVYVQLTAVFISTLKNKFSIDVPFSTCRSGRHAALLEPAPSNLTEVLSGITSASHQHDSADSETEDEHQCDDDSEDGLAHMSATCPIWDSMLPLDASQLKAKQVIKFIYESHSIRILHKVII